jgi:hypothetical protein
MVDSPCVRVVLYLETDVEAIRGIVWAAGSGRRDFYGWIELANALEVARTPPRLAERDTTVRPPGRPAGRELAPVSSAGSTSRNPRGLPWCEGVNTPLA